MTVTTSKPKNVCPAAGVLALESGRPLSRFIMTARLSVREAEDEGFVEMLGGCPAE